MQSRNRVLTATLALMAASAATAVVLAAPNAHAQAVDTSAVVADHGSRGDFVKVDQILNDGSVFFTQTDRIVRLTFPSGGSPSRGGGPASRLDREHLAVLSLPIDLTLSNSPSLASPGQIGGENALPPLEQTVLVGLNVGSASTAQGRGVLDTLFAAHHKDSHWLDVEGWDAFTQDLASGLRL